MSTDGIVVEAAPLVSQPEAAAAPSPVEAAVQQAIAALDFEALAAEFRDQNEFIFIPRFLPGELVAEMEAELRGFSRDEIHRVFVPFVRKAGTIAQPAIAAKAPVLHALYRSQALIDFARRLTGAPLEFKNDVDAHAAALYVYDRRGDHVGFHYDDCGCEGTSSYTATFGLVNETTSQVIFQLFREDRTREMKELKVSMVPGSLVFFCGAKAYHRVTPLGKGELRTTYSFAYVREGKRVRGFRRFQENIKDAILYFGPKAIFQKNYR